MCSVMGIAVTLSSTEAEYILLSKVVREACLSIGLFLTSLVIYEVVKKYNKVEYSKTQVRAIPFY